MSAASSVLAGLDDIRSWQEDLYRDLHQHPELSRQEHVTAGKVADSLGRFGYQVHTGVGGTGVVGTLRNGSGPTVLLRADMDALPVREETGLPYASTATATGGDGTEVAVAHACGHDMHVACLLGAAGVLANAAKQWHGTVIALFQPAEETGDGARAMVEDRLAAMIVIRLQTIVSRETPLGEMAVLTVGSLQAGTKSNIIPDHAVLQLNIRTYSDPTRERILDAIRRIVTAECAASGSPKDAEFELFDRFPLTDNDAETTGRVAAAFRDFFGERAQPMLQQTASEDFSDIPTALGTPYTYWGVGCSDPERYRAAVESGRVAEDIPVNHSAGFAPVLRPTLDTGTQALVVAALAWLAH